MNHFLLQINNATSKLLGWQRALMGASVFVFALFQGNLAVAQQNGFRQVISQVQPKIAKITGSGGFAGLEPYQSGFLISEEGHVLTVWSYVLDTDSVTVTLDDGQRFQATLLGYDPRIEIAVLKIEAKGLNYFKLGDAVEGRPASRVLAFSNLYGVATGNESASVQHGIVSAKTGLSARRGAFDSTYNGEVLILDAMTNNPGSAGGAITDRKGRLLGLIGKELRDSQTNSWLNFGVPIEQLAQSVGEIRDGKKVVQFDATVRKPTEPLTLDLLGIVLVPNVVSRTPPFVDRVLGGSAAEKNGILADDLIVEIDGRMTPSAKDLKEQLSHIDRDSNLRVVIQRGKKFKSFDIQLGR